MCVFTAALSSRNRYQYYLQVKKDVLEGRLRCTLEQVIRLAGLAVQGKAGSLRISVFSLGVLFPRERSDSLERPLAEAPWSFQDVLH